MQEKEKPENPFENDPLFLEVMAEALAIQDRFSAETIYAKTGKGYLKSISVTEITAEGLGLRGESPLSLRSSISE